MPELHTLPQDIFNLFDPNAHHEPNEENLNAFAESLKDLLRTRLSQREEREGGLRFSNIGKRDRQLWFEAHPLDGSPPEELTAKTYFKFLYGDIIEQMILFLAKEAGHTVEQEQAEVEVDGVLGHIDAIIDGVVVDVKSASPFGFKKFREGGVINDDPFGYVKQLAGYSDVLTPGAPAAWVAFDKVGGDICVSWLGSSTIAENRPAPRIQELRQVLDQPEPPPLCELPVPDGKSGNLKLPTICSYCSHKRRCHPGLRTFLYSTGPRFLTAVGKVPDVPEVVINGDTEFTD